LATHANPIRFTDEEARKIYEALGKLTENEMRDLLHNHSVTTRDSYLRNVYGYSAGMVARRVFNAWQKQHMRKCSTNCTKVK